jgi:hypothetical protein
MGTVGGWDRILGDQGHAGPSRISGVNAAISMSIIIPVNEEVAA